MKEIYTRIFFAFIICLHHSAVTDAQFIQFIGTNASDFGTSIITTSDGAYALGMELSLNAPQNDSTSATLVKTDCLGNVDWSRNYVLDQINYATDVIETRDSALLMEMTTYQPFFISPEVALIKTDIHGNFLWCRKMPLSGSQGNRLMEDSNGNIYLIANTKYVQGSYDNIALLKFTSSGNLIWAKKFSSTYGCVPINIAFMPGNKLAVLGRTALPGAFFTDVMLMITDTSGNQLKTVVAGTYYDDEPMDLSVDNTGNINVCGRTYFMNRNWDAMQFYFDNNLNLLGTSFYDGGTSEGEVFRESISDGSSAYLFGDEGTFDERNLVAVKSDGNGNIDWSKHYTVATIFTNYIQGVCKNRSNGFLITGDVEEGARLRDALLMDLDSSGDAGCQTSPFQFTVYHDAVTRIDTLISDSVLIIAITDTIPYIPDDAVSTITRCGAQTMCINFTAQQDSICPKPCITLNDLSTGNTSTTWSIYHDNTIQTSSEREALICFDQEGDYFVTLKIMNSLDTMSESKTIHVEKDCPLFIPNIFTPNNDNVNDQFNIRELPEQFTLEIINRWGNQVFETTEPGKFWDGKNENGSFVSAGVYYYVLHLTADHKTMKGWVEVRY